MARTITDEEIKLSIVINGNPAQKQLLDLEKATRRLNEEQKSLYLEKKRLEAQGLKESAQYKEITAKIKANNIALTENKNAMKELQNQIGITGLTMKQLSDKAHLLKMTLRNFIPGSSDYKRYQDELNQVNARIGELNGRASQTGFSLGKVADGFNRYAALGASVLGFFAGMVVSIQKIIDVNGKLSEAQTNVMKTTGMTKKEVDDLTKSFGVLQTRTARIDLLGIAETGGRLGIAKEDIQDFVKVMDKASVALGDSFEGGPDVVAEKLGRIKGLYGELKDASVETAFESVGSALNELGAAGTASEANLSEFVTRVGAMPEAFKPSIAEALGLGAAFEESGIKAEVAAGNYSKVISIASNNAAGFAQVMGKSKKEIEDLLNTNPNEFFLQFADSLKGMNAVDLAKTLDALKLNDNEVKMVLGAASKNTDLFREKIDLANQSLAEGTSLTKEFDIKNNNFAATLEKIKKTVSGLFTADGFVAWLESAVNWFAKFIGATEDADGSVTAWRNTLVFTAKIIAIVTAAMITHNAWQKLVVLWSNRNTQATVLYNLATKARAVADGVATLATQGLALVQMLLTGNIKGATQALRVMNTVLKTSPWGFVLSMIAAVVVAYQSFSSELSKTEKLQKSLADVELETAKSISKQKSELEKLVKIAQDETNSKEARFKAIKRLNEISPEYLGNLNIENIKTFEAKKAIDSYTESLYKNARAKAVQAKYDELVSKRIEVENKTSKDFETTGEKIGSFFGQSSGKEFANRDEVNKYVLETFGSYIDKKVNPETGEITVNREKFRALVEKYIGASGLKIKEQELADIDAELALYEAELEKNFKDKTVVTEETITTGGGGVTPTGDDDKKKEKKYDDSYLEDEKRRQKELYELQMKNEEERIKMLKDGYLKEALLENLRHADKLHGFEENINDLLALQSKLDKEIVEAEKTGDTKKATSLKKQREYVVEQQKYIGTQVEHEKKMHLLRMATIQEKGGMQEVDKLKEKYEREKQLRETAFLEEMASLSLSEEEKEKRKKEFQERELQMEEAMLKEQINLLNKMIDDVNFEGIDFSLLSPEDEEKLRIQIEAIQNAIAKLKSAKNGDVEENSKKELDLGIGGETDVLGFTQDQWDKFFQNINNGTVGFQTMAFAIQAAGQIFSQVDQYMTASENASLKKYERGQDARKRALKRQLDSGQINQVQYKRKVEELDQELDRKKAEVEYKQAKRQRIMSIANVITSTAQAIMSIWAQVPKFDFGATAGILTGMVTAMGALQLGTILKTPLPAKGFEEGLYPDYVKREQDGKIFKSSGTSKMETGLYSKPRILVGEGPGDMPELVIDKRAFAQISPETKSALFRELRGIKGFENGYYKDDVFYTGNSVGSGPAPVGSDSELIKMMLAVVAENTSIMKDLKESGIIAYFSKDYRDMKKFVEEMEKFKSLREKNRK